MRARGRRRRGTRRRASRIRAITLRNAPRRRRRVSRASVQSGFSEGTHHVGRCVFFLPTSGRRVSGRAFCDDADAGVSRNSEGVSPEPSNRVARDLWRGVRSLRRGSVCARRRPACNLIITQTALDFNLAQTPAAPIRMGKETQSAHFRFCNSRTRVYVVVESQVHRGTFFLACCRSIQSNARASNRRRVAHPRSPPRPDFVQPALVSE